ncbi:MAG: threonine aldolase family protein [Desulfovibrio sp.]
MIRSFASDNNSGIDPAIMEAIIAANTGDAPAYGDDDLSHATDALFKKHFGEQAKIHYLTTGTAANVLGLRAVTRTWNSIICADVAHINVDECGAPEAFSGCKLVPVPTTNGKIDVKTIRPYLFGRGTVHHSQPKVIQITQCTELGTLYQPEEIKSICDYAHKEGLYVHLDGARLANAAAALNCTFKELTTDLGVDVLSFGGTKNGLMMGETVVFLNPDLGTDFQYMRKQGMQLVSKMRFVSAQFHRYLSDDMWRDNANAANNAAKYLADKVQSIPEVTITRPVQTNAVFAYIPEHAIKPLQADFPFYVWNEDSNELRWMTSFDTTEEEIDSFVMALKRAI